MLKERRKICLLNKFIIKQNIDYSKPSNYDRPLITHKICGKLKNKIVFYCANNFFCAKTTSFQKNTSQLSFHSFLLYSPSRYFIHHLVFFPLQNILRTSQTLPKITAKLQRNYRNDCWGDNPNLWGKRRRNYNFIMKNISRLVNFGLRLGGFFAIIISSDTFVIS